MSKLAQLFESEPVTRAAQPPAVSADRVAALFPPRRTVQAAAVAQPADDIRELHALVGGRGPARAVGGPTAAPRRIRRAGQRRDWFSIVIALVAVAAMVVTGAVAWVVVSSASPEADALRTLSQTEAVLTNNIQAVGAGIERLEAAKAASAASAAAFEAALAELDGVDGVDEKALAAAEQARAGYAAALAPVAVPEPLPAYVRPPIDDESLASIGAAIDGVTTRSNEVGAVAATVRDVQQQLATLDATFTVAMATFAATFADQAKAIADDNPDAQQSFRDDVTDAADAITTSALATPESAATLPAYAGAVDALLEDQARAEEVIRQEELRRQREREEQARQEQNPPEPSPTTEPPADEG